MATNLSILIDKLRPFLGDFAEEYVALELSLVNNNYVDIAYGREGIYVWLRYHELDIDNQDMDNLLNNLHYSLEIIIGAHQTRKLIESIEYALFDGLRTEILNTVPLRITQQG